MGITTGLYGAGGFGKTTLAKMACADDRVKERFGRFVYPVVTVGRDLRGPEAVAAKVNDVIKLVVGENSTFTDPQLAGARLGSLLDTGPPALLVIDDVWEPEQLLPFLIGGRACSRLVTTRVPELLDGRGTAVCVDQMSPEQARALLTAGLPPLQETVVAGLLAVTGRWPLLLRLVNKILADYAQMAAEVDTQGTALVHQLRAGGPAVVDEVLGEDQRTLDVGQPSQRERAVRATIEASTGLLSGDDSERFAELSVFAEDEVIPFGLVAQLWRATAGLDELRVAQVVRRLAQLALVSQAGGPDGGVVLHDVIRDFLRANLGQRQLAELNGALVDAAAAGLPAASPLDGAAQSPVPTAWWELGQEDRYLWDHLIEHMRGAGQPDQAEAVVCDLRWVGARLQRFGPAAPAADLAAAGTPRASRLRAVLARTTHLLAPTEPNGAVVDVLHSRVAEDPDWGPEVTALRDICRQPRLVNRWPLPDLGDPALRRVLTGHTDGVEAVAVAPDGSWLVTGSRDGTARIWDVPTGQRRATLTGHTDGVEAVAVAPDGSWLVTGSRDGTARIWDVPTGQRRATLPGHSNRVVAVAVAPDGSWLATGSWDGTARIWEAPTGQELTTLTGHTGGVEAVAVAPGGSWLATGSMDGTVRIWEVATWQKRVTLIGHTGWIWALAWAADGSWLASGGADWTVRIWDVSTWQRRAALTGPTDRVKALAVAPDGSWLATGILDGTVQIWDLPTGQERATLTGHNRWVAAVAVAPGGSWLATGGADGTARIWDIPTGQRRPTLTGHTGGVEALAVAPDGSWLATAGADRTVRIWDVPTGQQRASLTGHTDAVPTLEVAPDGSWLATGDVDHAVRIWDVPTGQQRASLTGHTDAVRALAVAPDGSWLASGSVGGEVRIWDVPTGQQRASLTGHTDAVTTLAVAPDGSWLATGILDGTVQIWDVPTGKEHAIATGRTGGVTGLAWAPDGSWLACGNVGGEVRIWDVPTWQVRTDVTGHAGWARPLAVAPDGSWLAVGSMDGEVRIWDVPTGQQRAILTGHTGQVEAVMPSPDGSWLATSSRGGEVRIWDVAAWQTRSQMRLDNIVNASAWLGADALAVGGSAGLYLFGFLAGATSATTAHGEGQHSI